MNQKAAAAGEFIALLGDDADRKFLLGEVGAGEVTLGFEWVGIIAEVGAGLGSLRVQSVEEWLARLVPVDARGVVVGGHGGSWKSEGFRALLLVPWVDSRGLTAGQ